jgi:hypothetical protein
MGIPFGCGTVLLVVLAGFFAQYQPPLTLLLTGVAATVTAFIVAAAALIPTEWFLENRGESSPN